MRPLSSVIEGNILFTFVKYNLYLIRNIFVHMREEKSANGNF